MVYFFLSDHHLCFDKSHLKVKVVKNLGILQRGMIAKNTFSKDKCEHIAM